MKGRKNTTLQMVYFYIKCSIGANDKCKNRMALLK